ncbi:sulfatase-like hydrolase/transferase [Streptomyces sp. NPDC003832]
MATVPAIRARYAPDLLQERAPAFLDAHGAEPFLLCLTPNLPHAPSQVPGEGEYADRPWPGPDRRHAARIGRLDSLVGEIVDRPTRLGVADRTPVLVTGDNGPHEEEGANLELFDVAGPLRGCKRNLYEVGIGVPLIARSPGRVRPGTTDRPTPLTDLLPTLADLAGASAPTDLDGLSLAPLPRDTGPAARHDDLYFYRNHNGVTPRSDAEDRGRPRPRFSAGVPNGRPLPNLKAGRGRHRRRTNHARPPAFGRA